MRRCSFDGMKVELAHVLSIAQALTIANRRAKKTGVPIAAFGVDPCSNETGVRELEPPQGTYLGGEEILIHGRNFPVGRGGVSVSFGRRNATNVVLESPNGIKVTSPAGDKNTEVDIVVMFDDGRAYLLKNGFRYLDAADNQKVMKNFKMK
jgi:hypothetical protein